MDGFSRILEKKLYKLLCTRVYLFQLFKVKKNWGKQNWLFGGFGGTRYWLCVVLLISCFGWNYFLKTGFYENSLKVSPKELPQKLQNDENHIFDCFLGSCLAQIPKDL